MAVLPNQRVPVRRPGTLTPRYGLFTVTRAMGTLNDNLPPFARQGGLVYETTICDCPVGYETNCISALTPKTVGDPSDQILGDPFVVISRYSCGLVGQTEETYRTFLVDQVQANDQGLVESIFSAGTFGQAPSLANNVPAATNVGPATNVVEAFSQLETALYACYGVPGVIHVPYIAAAYIQQAWMAVPDAAGVWRTNLGTAVSFGNYAGTGPAGEVPAAGTVYLYATGQTSIWRTPIEDVEIPPFDQIVNRTTNQVDGYLEREYVVAFECGSYATLTTLGTV